MRIVGVILVIVLVVGGIQSKNCNIPDQQKTDCGYLGIQQSQCEQKGCCWVPVGTDYKSFSERLKRYGKDADEFLGGTPWCFYGGSNSCDKINLVSNTTGFDEQFMNQMYSNFFKNLNIDQKGGVVASPDTGMKYDFDWMRDEALSLRAYLEINDNNLTKAQKVFPDYVQWVIKTQNDTDPFGVDVRVEPKFDLPNGNVYSGQWCRPQTDGPALRAIALIKYAYLLQANQSYIKQYLWTSGDYHGGAIRYHLEWVANYWPQVGCDLWEEIQSDNFFWNRMAFRYALDLGSQFAAYMGDQETSVRYKTVALQVKATLDGHWTGSFMEESSNRPKDSSVIHAFSSFPGVYKFSDPKVAATIKVYNNLFCNSYVINQADNDKGIPGILYGRYEGDTYQGGNPWQLLSAVLANLFYQVANELNASSGPAPQTLINAWKDLLQLDSNVTYQQFAQKAKSAGDSVLYRIYTHVKDGNGNVYEQMDKVTGTQKSAYSLTWSYANILSALHFRKQNLSTL